MRKIRALNNDLKNKLVDTGDRTILIKNMGNYWGTDDKNDGENIIGLMMEEIRQK